MTKHDFDSERMMNKMETVFNGRSLKGLYMLDNRYLNYKMREEAECKRLLFVFIGEHYDEVKHTEDSGQVKEILFEEDDTMETHILAKPTEDPDLVHDIKINAIKNPRVLEALWREWTKEDSRLSIDTRDGKLDENCRYYRVILTNFDSLGKGNLSEIMTNKYHIKNIKTDEKQTVQGLTKFVFVDTYNDLWQFMPNEWYHPKKGRPKPRSKWSKQDKEFEKAAFIGAQNYSYASAMVLLAKEADKKRTLDKNNASDREFLEHLAEIKRALTVVPEWVKKHRRKMEKLGIDIMVDYYMQREFNMSMRVKTDEGDMDISIHTDSPGDPNRSWNMSSTKVIEEMDSPFSF